MSKLHLRPICVKFWASPILVLVDLHDCKVRLPWVCAVASIILYNYNLYPSC